MEVEITLINLPLYHTANTRTYKHTPRQLPTAPTPTLTSLSASPAQGRGLLKPLAAFVSGSQQQR
jgi:hypothetical protein